jgi:nicotinate-nucleotide adenylyltransferase
VRLAQLAWQRLPIDRLLVIPAGDHPHKHSDRLSPAPDRLAMCRLAFSALPYVTVDDRELRRDGPAYTVDTLAELQAEAGGTPLYFVIGGDNLVLLPTWYRHHRLLELATVVTCPRAGHAVDASALEGLDLTAAERSALLANVLPADADPVSASDVRARIRGGERRPKDLPDAVADYIAAHGLYR